MSSAILENHALSSYLTRGALASIIVHFFLVMFILLSTKNWREERRVLPENMMVSFIPEEPSAAARQNTQIVSPSEQSENRPPPDDAFFSERDAAVAQQQIRRGDSEDAGVPGKQVGGSVTQPKQPPSEEPNQRVAKASKAPRALALDNKTLQEDFALQPETAEDRLRAALSGEVGGAPISSLASVQPFSRLRGSGARILGTRGSSDFLPTLPDGDITLLNTKANLFAVFVRRVAIQVFSNLRASGWERLRAQDVQGMASDTTVKAVLSKSGSLLSVSLASSSGSPRFDDVLKDAVQRGARDPNPPEAAALADGNIHFVFKARSWVQFGSDPRTGAPSERRWLVLGTGLE